VIDEDGAQLGIMPPFEALKLARGKGLDLVEVAPAANPPVCRIINYGKYLYQLNKRQHEARKHQKSFELKEVKFRPRTSGHDFEVKRNRITRFLQEGSKVKTTVMFRGRENAHRDIGFRMLERLIEELNEVGQVESRPRQEGPTLAAILAPKKATGKSSGGKARSSAESSSAPASARQAPGHAERTARAAATPKPTDSSGGQVG
jgi:translation initiation factor IF-3